MSNLYTEEIIPIHRGFMTLIGYMTSKDEPIENGHGNCFSLMHPNPAPIPENSFDMGIEVANFRWENLELAMQKFNLTDVKIRNYGSVILIDDERIPKNYYCNHWCPIWHCGNGKPSVEILREIFDFMGIPEELERYESPATFKEKERIRAEELRQDREN